VLPTFIFSFFLIPLVLPWKLSRFFWTFIIPLIPLVAGIDIVMSCFRTRNVKELNQMVSTLQSESYEWETGKLPTYLGLTLTYLVGKPR
jgi:ABC-type multidrug transport system permease subunit